MKMSEKIVKALPTDLSRATRSDIELTVAADALQVSRLVSLCPYKWFSVCWTREGLQW